MDWSPSTWWWIAAGTLAVLELATGTFYVLMLAVGAAFGALASYVTPFFFAQVVVALVVGGAAVVAWHQRRRRRTTGVSAAANPDLNLDIGEPVQVDGWSAEGTARVAYRGSAWNVRWIGDGQPAPGLHLIAEVRHNELALRRA